MLRKKTKREATLPALKVLLELSEEEVDVVDGVELCDEGLYILQERLRKQHNSVFMLARPHGRQKHESRTVPRQSQS